MKSRKGITKKKGLEMEMEMGLKSKSRKDMIYDGERKPRSEALRLTT